MSKLKQLLFSLNETDRRVIEEKLKEKDQQIDQLKQQLEEYKNKENTSAVNSLDEMLKNCDNCSLNECIGCEYTQTCVQNIKQQLAEKDKEVERLKNLFELNNEVVINQGKEMFDLRVQVLQQKQNQTQLTIQELEKLRNDIWELYIGDYYLQNGGILENIKIKRADVLKLIDQQIKELKGENNTFKCEICGEITPKKCEGGEPNVCAGCVPTETHDLSTEIEPQSHENDFLD